MIYDNMLIPIIIPSLEPDERLLTLLRELTIAGYKNIVIVNDGSSSDYDCFFQSAEHDYGCVVLVHDENMGKGRALKNAFNYCLDTMPNIIGCITADSDGQHSVECISKCMDALMANTDKLVLGVRNFSGGNIPRKSMMGNKITCKVCKYLCGLSISDTQTGLRGIPKSFMEELLDVPGERFEFETQMLVASINRYDIYEVEIKTIYDSVDNHVTHFDPIKDSFRIYKIFVKIFARYTFSSLSSWGVDLAFFALFEWILIKSASTFRAYIALATVLARILSATYNYLMNYVFVFKSIEKHSKAGYKYFLLAFIQMGFSALFTTLLSMGSWMSDITAKIIVDGTLFFISYYIQRRFIFYKSKKDVMITNGSVL
ncbi:MAG: glycosyltransferase [Ruminococcaceae bacterium]|nr:glycosyltransferase [Oscillospiraceae bacterium]